MKIFQLKDPSFLSNKSPLLCQRVVTTTFLKRFAAVFHNNFSLTIQIMSNLKIIVFCLFWLNIVLFKKYGFCVFVLNKMRHIFLLQVIQKYFEAINCGGLVFHGIDIENFQIFFFPDFPIKNGYNIFAIRSSILIHCMILIFREKVCIPVRSKMSGLRHKNIFKLLSPKEFLLLFQLILEG